ncbi:oxygen-dependent tRNA uridine(34) hydroxylase TrhO [Methylovirgula sp. 4M-Z18]|uniref:oxygen-dependent tRNA uridine(34) hydroxylase TrhO n=1 Tax=Methylovirgula sp. 4M-Z18 TaxID=2293567 RepID=UPI000E2FEF7B|nr:rhodanese-related sulfurtransferase [Methylovirgula sp. 4M-Z18]RFB80462.1 rhodanese-related sulfurtransferase [Methylovirgula sp. 4M-Z18]
MSEIHVAAFYQFARLPQYRELQPRLQAACDENGIKGIVLLAPEGINGTIAGAPDALHRAIDQIREITGLKDLDTKLSHAETMPFLRMKVRLKTEIVTIGDTGVDPTARVGTYVEPEDWNALISDPDVVVIDTRNAYEYAIGTFRNAIDPQTKSFGEFPSYVRQNLDPAKHKKIAMFCTGGIRCEKASSFMLNEGFEEVYHLNGGILKYLERVPQAMSLWDGACFVFDQRVAVGHGLELADVATCFGCRAPLTVEDRQSADYERGVSCPHCAATMSEEQKASARERQRQVDLAEARGKVHLGPPVAANGPQG